MASGFYLVGQVQVIAAGWSETVSKLRKCGVIDYRCLRWMWKWAVGLHTHAVDRHPSRRPSEGLQRGRELPRVTQQASDIFLPLYAGSPLRLTAALSQLPEVTQGGDALPGIWPGAQCQLGPSP